MTVPVCLFTHTSFWGAACLCPWKAAVSHGTIVDVGGWNDLLMRNETNSSNLTTLCFCDLFVSARHHALSFFPQKHAGSSCADHPAGTDLANVCRRVVYGLVHPVRPRDDQEHPVPMP